MMERRPVIVNTARGPVIFANFNPKMTDDSYQEKFPYVKTREVILLECDQIQRQFISSSYPKNNNSATFIFI